jgi:peptidyl-prolyl cis-trans isomerase C
MTHKGLVCLLLGSLAWGQAAKPAQSSGAQKPGMQSSEMQSKSAASAEKSSEMPDKAADPAKVAPDAAVITLSGVCASSSADKADCKTVVTKQDFEKLVNAVAPNIPPAARRQLATRYATALAMATEAEKKGLDKGPNFEEMMKISRVQVLAQELQKSVQEKAAQISDKDVEDYYNNDKQAFEEATVQRLFIPRSKQLAPAKAGTPEADVQKQQEQAQAAMKTEADALQKRAAAGESFDKLQQEAFDAAGMKAKAPNTSMPKARRNTLPATHESIFDLKTGDVSPLISDASGYFVYKMGEKSTIPLEEAKEEIRNALRAQRMQDEMQRIQAEAQPNLNEEYFGPESAQEGGVPGMMMGKTPKPGSTKPKAEPPQSK